MAGIDIKLAVVTKPGSAQNIVADKFKDLIEARSDGNIKVKVYHSASLGNETEILQQVQMNTIQMAVVTGGTVRYLRSHHPGHQLPIFVQG